MFSNVPFSPVAYIIAMCLVLSCASATSQHAHHPPSQAGTNTTPRPDSPNIYNWTTDVESLENNVSGDHHPTWRRPTRPIPQHRQDWARGIFHSMACS
ncbi:hypothetical protein GGR50DRAFT_643692 [Xylaria sp. CBS 124048]|nr:hypothetical protein GGR50DRAFT_643692 [Xylaria sp. CBS 124048]